MVCLRANNTLSCVEPFLEASVESDHNDGRNEIRYSFVRLLNLDFKRAVFKQIAIV